MKCVVRTFFPEANVMYTFLVFEEQLVKTIHNLVRLHTLKNKSLLHVSEKYKRDLVAGATNYSIFTTLSFQEVFVPMTSRFKDILLEDRALALLYLIKSKNILSLYMHLSLNLNKGAEQLCFSVQKPIKNSIKTESVLDFLSLLDWSFTKEAEKERKQLLKHIVEEWTYREKLYDRFVHFTQKQNVAYGTSRSHSEDMEDTESVVIEFLKTETSKYSRNFTELWCEYINGCLGIFKMENFVKIYIKGKQNLAGIVYKDTGKALLHGKQEGDNRDLVISRPIRYSSIGEFSKEVADIATAKSKK